MNPTVPLVEKVARLRSTLLFDGLEPEALRALARVSEVERFSPGEFVVREGEAGDALYIITRGLLRVQGRIGSRDAVLGEIHKGGFFGEFALLERQRRNASVEAVSPTSVLRLSREALMAQFDRHPAIEERLRKVLERRRSAGRAPAAPTLEEKVRVLAHVLELSEEAAQAVADAFEWHWLPPGEILIREGEPGDALFLLMAGQLRVYTEANGREVLIMVLSGHAIVGEMALISGEPRSASVCATTSSQVLRLDRETFDELLATKPEVLGSFRELMLTRIAHRARQEQMWNRDGSRAPITAADCEDVVRTRDLVLRNFKITHSYYRLALDLADVIGRRDVVWPAFGAHASKSAGHAIRKEEMPFVEGASKILQRVPGVRRILRRGGDRVARTRLVRSAGAVLERVSDAVSDGNLRIFGDMAPAIVRFVELMRTDAANDPAAMAAFCASLKPGPPEIDGQDVLGQALMAWYEASRESDTKRRCELVLLGNARMGLHEQVRIQPDLEQALGAALRGFVGDELTRAVGVFGPPLPKALKQRVRSVTRAVERRMHDLVATRLRRLITRRMMRLRLPGGEVWLSADIPVAAGALAYPEELEVLTHPELLALFSRFARNQGSTTGSGALDWCSLDDRMNFILHLFRSRICDQTLYSPPLPPGMVDAWENSAAETPPPSC